MGDSGRGHGYGRGRRADRGGGLGGGPHRVQARGERRQGYGTLGVPVDIIVNCFRADVPLSPIYHYDNILPADQDLPTGVTIAIIRKMQEQYPAIFTKRGSYDGRKNLYSPIEYSLGEREQFEVNEPDRPTPWVVRIKRAASPWQDA